MRRFRLEKLRQASPLYAQLLTQFPQWADWFEAPENRPEFRYQALADEWRRFLEMASEPYQEEHGYLERLRRWRRRMSLRIAYRTVNGLATEPSAVGELTRLAEFCIRECHQLSWKRWLTRFGDPWDEEQNRPARFAVLALGKLGGEELNFSSDVDLIFLYEGDGYCRRDGRDTPFSTVEFFTKVAETTIASLSAATEAGFLFRVDARLRPEGAGGPLVRSVSSLENYYALAGQTWERLAWLKARPIAGDISLGAELLESLQDFRYPRHPAPSLLSEIAATKARTEREIVGTTALNRDVKRGTGGIREIEFIVQANQLLHAGRYPFLQTHQTQTALEQLLRYGVLTAPEVERLSDAYWFLRQVEHRIQMRDEQQSHSLPQPGVALTAIAESLNFNSVAEFEIQLAETRRQVRSAYDALLADRTDVDQVFEAWWTFLTTDRVPPVVEKRLQAWLGDDPQAASEVRLLARADASRLLTREQVMRFLDLASSLDFFMPELARPALTLRRLTRFAERYGSRSHFFSTCANYPRFLRSLALVFDRSTAIHELLCAYPEIFEEVLRPENLRLQKDSAAFDREMGSGPTDHAEFSRWFALYLHAEQVRAAISELLGIVSREQAQAWLSRLADAALVQLCRRQPALEKILIIGLGKFGGEELTLGSDLDLLFIADTPDIAALEQTLRDTLRLFQSSEAFGPIFAIDTRLRPHGEAGPLIVTPKALSAYHARSGQLWERQLLVRARVIAGPSTLRSEWDQFIEHAVFGRGLTDAQLEEIWRMRLRIQKERDVASPPQRAFKTGAGGLMDYEFLAQIFQLRHGQKQLGLRTRNTRAVLLEMERIHLISASVARIVLENYEFVKQVEWMVRRDLNQPVAVLPADLEPLARWLGFPSKTAFWDTYCSRLAQTRTLVLAVLFDHKGIVHNLR